MTHALWLLHHQSIGAAALGELTLVSMLPNTMAKGHFSVSASFDFWVPLLLVEHSLGDHHPLWDLQYHVLLVFLLACWWLLPLTCSDLFRLLYPGTSSLPGPHFS